MPHFTAVDTESQRGQVTTQAVKVERGFHQVCVFSMTVPNVFLLHLLGMSVEEATTQEMG